jgi:Tol biopolymer transport system component
MQIWQCSVDSGEARAVTNDLLSYDLFSLSTTADTRSLIAVQSDPASQIWVMSVADVGHPRVMSSQKDRLDGQLGLAWTPDGKIVFDSLVNGNRGLWKSNADGTDLKQLTDSAVDGFAPEVSTGTGIVFFESTRSSFQIWRMDPDGRNSKQMTNGEGAPTFSVSPDGKWLYYAPYSGGIYKMPVEGGEGTPVIDNGALTYPQVSPDGRSLAYLLATGETSRSRIVVIDLTTGRTVKTLELPVSVTPPQFDSWNHRGFHWAPDGSGLIYINTLAGISNLWRQPLDGSAAKQITSFTSDRIYNFAYSQDGKMLAVARGSSSPNVVLIKDQQ